uniref:ATP synthase complex subunit 8 n=1 Tax=Cucujoidea sp. 12 KM-2017 TaxID=2219348 RepID=A0A346RJX4_9CUCU|nr:ATP synthase F0 subunit 8 [Cucujoidea sp. 12 KM-2017]
MPQMAPMNWLTLMIFFSIIFMIFNSMNYFSFTYPSITQSIKTSKKFFSWKW